MNTGMPPRGRRGKKGAAGGMLKHGGREVRYEEDYSFRKGL